MINPQHLLDQAERLLDWPATGRPRQADIKRAISTAYYAIFHAVMSAVADQIVGAGRRTRSLYVLVYRSIDHVTLRMLCQEITKSTLAPKYRVVAPSGRFHSSLTLFAERVIIYWKSATLAIMTPCFGFPSQVQHSLFRLRARL